MINLSVIIPTYNRAERLRACLESLTRQTQPPSDFEVVVVVDGSTDGTREMLRKLVTPYRLTTICQRNKGQNAALNRGIQAAKGRFCLFLDDDIIPEPEFVEEHLQAQQTHKGVIGLGQLTLNVPDGADWFVRAYAQSWTNHYAGLNQCSRTPTWLDCFGGNLSAPRSALLQVGGVATDLPYGHDVELAYRLYWNGLPIVYIPGALGHQDDGKGFPELARDFERSGACWLDIYRRHPPVLPHLLGSFHHTKWRAIVLQHFLLAFSVPPRIAEFLIKLTGKRDYKVFHFLRNYCYWRGVRRAVPDRETWRRLTGGTRILMYHAFGNASEPASRFVIPVRHFARQMAWIKRLGFNVISLEEFLACRAEHRLPPARSVIITIDDGYADTHKLAFPVLAANQFPATIFLVSREVNGTNRWSRDDDLADRPLLSWADIRRMREGGMQFGAHSRTHPDLTRLSPDAAREEIEGSRSDLEEKLGIPVRTFAYPYGESNSTVEGIAEQAGFLGSCGIEPGLNTLQTSLNSLHRTEIFGTDSLLTFLGRLWLGQSRILRLLQRAR